MTLRLAAGPLVNAEGLRREEEVRMGGWQGGRCGGGREHLREQQIRGK